MTIGDESMEEGQPHFGSNGPLFEDMVKRFLNEDPQLSNDEAIERARKFFAAMNILQNSAENDSLSQGDQSALDTSEASEDESD
jgi:hypothetical protein